MNQPLQQVRSVEAKEGAGVRIRRAIGVSTLPSLDPFLMLDFFDSENASDYQAGFPDHPHRGFITLTYMLEGRMEHRDSMGHQGVIGPGDAQWMKAASGVIHSEMPRQIEGRMAGFQLWINLPAAEKMAPPEYQEYAAADFPVHADGEVTVKVLAGEFGGVTGPISDSDTHVHYFDGRLAAGRSLALDVPGEHVGFVFVHAGSVAIGGEPVAFGTLARLGGGPHEVTARGGSAGFIVAHGRPIGEPIVQRGPFVMNTAAEIHQAVMDYHAGRLVQPVAAGQLRS
ncbi:MAG: pirin family protein [Pseudomonadota bacterium]